MSPIFTTILNILTILSVIIGGVSFLFVMRNQIGIVAKETADLKEDVKLVNQQLAKMTEILIIQGRLDERVTAMYQQMVNQGKRVDDLTRRMNTFLDLRGVNLIEGGNDAEH